VEFSLDDAEFAALCEAAGRAGLSRGAYAARAAAGAAAGRPGGGQLLREALAEMVRCAGQVRKIGTNLNVRHEVAHAKWMRRGRSLMVT
jgi:hypothetical protein